MYEEKVDGWRMVAHKDGRAVRLVSRQGAQHTERFPSVAAAVAQLPARRLILDGEVAVFDEHLISRFDWLPDAPDDAVATPPIFVAFDCLMVNGRDLRTRPIRDRRLELERVAAGSDVLPVRRLASDGRAAWAEVHLRGHEGLVAKNEASPYICGPTRSWLKVKVRREGRFHIGRFALRVESSRGCSSVAGSGCGCSLPEPWSWDSAGPPWMTCWHGPETCDGRLRRLDIGALLGA